MALRSAGCGSAAALALCAALGCSVGNPEFVCQPGEHQCAGGRPVECQPSDGGVRLGPAQCPAAAGCSAGRCVAPPGAKSCARDRDCAALACTPLVAGGGLATSCLKPEGAVAGAMPCTKSSQCRSGLCIGPLPPTGKQLCYLACQTDADCAPSDKCRSFSITITGIQGTLKGCGP